MKKLFHISPFGRTRLTKVLLIITVLTVLLAIPTFFWMRDFNKQLAKRHNSPRSPLIMVPGSSAGPNRFDHLVKKLNDGAPHRHSYMKMKVYNNGKITYSGSIAKNDNEPIVVIAFQNNHDGYNNIKKQAKMLNKAFSQLCSEYSFNNFKAFGHSNGGLIWTYWLEHYYQDYDDEITMKRLMTLGSPFNFSERNVKNKTQMFSDFLKYRKRLPKDLIVYSLMGTETYDSDGLVPEESVEAGKYIFQKKVKHFTMMTLTGEDAQHSSLPQNEQVVQAINQELLDDAPTVDKKNGNYPKVKKATMP